METRESYKQIGYSGREFFQQQSPLLGNQFLEDSALIEGLKRVLPQEVYSSIQPDLVQFGDRVVKDILELGRQSENNPPKLIQYDAWGKRIDKLVIDESWNTLKDIGATEGLVSIGYERKYREYSRVYQYIKIYLFACSSAVQDCPLSMTDGGARLLELHGSKELMQTVYPHLTTRDPKQFWTTGQWMTEKAGGSDVANSETIAKEITGGQCQDNGAGIPTHFVSGYKYFTSATSSQGAMILARDTDAQGKSTNGSRGLSVFYVQLRDKNTGELNNIKIHKLKNKFGTKAVPTAELELINTPGIRVGSKGRGVPVIASILNITRIHNVIHSVSTMRRCVAIARDFAHRRRVFTSTLNENLLYLSTLAEMELEYRAGLQFLLDVSLLLGKSECNSTKETDSLLRILTPLSKLYTAKQSIWVASEAMECLGGTGYMEDSDLPRLFRDTQVTSIWEGTTNVLSMDVWRSIKSHNSLKYYKDSITARISASKSSSSSALFETSIKLINKALDLIERTSRQVMEEGDLQFAESNARRFSYLLSTTYMASLLLEQAIWSKKPVDAQICERWCFLKLQNAKEDSQSIAFINADEKWRELDKVLALDLNEKGEARGYGDYCKFTNQPRSRY
ncbi:hypothetical protein CYY_008138 [Polysphondylium violaceum]|uniref:Acyl-CoA dehydrogenase n=1 Tax=Polysphondylium violaceum TaxID=133409 RepID=A0A8J4PND5_9MYCE|nr:hypothetical protein CYY_008138 [Polysphondylium violaceum]